MYKINESSRQVRMETVKEYRKAQKDTLKYYNINSARFKSELTKEKSIDELRSSPRKFYFRKEPLKTIGK